MEKYTIHSVVYNDTTFYCVYENATEHVIDFFCFEDDAIKCKSFFDNGGAFSGFTPEFILKKIVLPGDVDNRFESI